MVFKSDNFEIEASRVEKEFIQLKDEYIQGAFRYRAMSQLYNFGGNCLRSKWTVGERNHFYNFLIKKNMKCKAQVSFEELSDRYIITKTILKQNPKMDYCLSKKTKFEEDFDKMFREKTNKKIFPSFLIAKVSSDFYIPSLGIVIEIDGKIHDAESKMKKDKLKIDTLAELGIKVISFNNEDIQNGAARSQAVKSFFNNINMTPLLNSRTQKLLMARIYLLTVCCRAEQFKILFDVDPSLPLSYLMFAKKANTNILSRSKLPRFSFSST